MQATNGYKPYFNKMTTMAVAVLPLLLAGCLATTPQAGGGSSTVATGAAAGGTATDANSTLETCPQSMGTVSIDEDTDAGWYSAYIARYNTGSTVPALRLLIQQSNCFVIVDRNRGLRAGMRERGLIRGDEGRAGSQYGGGQVAAADYTLLPEVIVSAKGGNQGGLSALSGLFGSAGSAVGAIAGNFSTNEAGTILTLIDNRSSVQLAAAEGYSQNVDFGVAGSLFSGGSSGRASAFTSTPQGKVLMASFMDAYNKMVIAVRNYRAQTVAGGLGTGGQLGVQGGSTKASKKSKKKK